MDQVLTNLSLMFQLWINNSVGCRMALGRRLRTIKAVRGLPQRGGLATVLRVVIPRSRLDPLPDSQVALERQLRTGEVHGRIQGKNKEEYTESNSSPLNSHPPSGKAAGAASAVTTRFLFNVRCCLSTGALGRLEPIHLRRFDVRGHQSRTRSGPKLVFGGYRSCRRSFL